MRVRMLKTFARESGCGVVGQIFVDPPAEFLEGLEYEVLGVAISPAVTAKPPQQEIDVPARRKPGRPRR